MRIRYAPLVVACALMVAVTSQAAPVTYSFGGTLDYPFRGVLPPFEEGDSFSGSFTFESSALDINPVPFIGDYTADFSIDVTVNGLVYSSSTTSSDCPVCGGVEVFNPPDETTHSFRAQSGLIGYPPVAGPNLGRYAPYQLTVWLFDSSQTVFKSDALPLNLVLSSFSSARLYLFFQEVNGPDNRLATGVITELTLLTAPPVPETSTSAMFALGLGALGIAARRRKAA